jgi:hypothetical protein
VRTSEDAAVQTSHVENGDRGRIDMANGEDILRLFTRSDDETMMTILMTALLVSGPTQQYVKLYVISRG